MRSTSSSRWKAVASRFSSFSISAASGTTDFEGAAVAAGVLLAGVEDDEGLSDMASFQLDKRASVCAIQAEVGETQ